MKSKMKKIILKFLSPFIFRLGFVKKNEIDNYLKNDLLLRLIKLLKSNNFTPNLIIDIGANHGSWSRLWKEQFPKTKFILVEPQYWLKSSFEDILDSNTIYLPIGAGKENGSFTFTINSERDDSSTFLYTEEEAKKLGFKQIEIPVKTINSIVSENGDEVPDVIKIDAEGIDIEVLDGSKDLWGKTEIFLVEASINSLMTKTDIIIIINYMNDAGYRLFDITDMNRPFSNNVLWLTELAFVRKGGYIDNLKWL